MSETRGRKQCGRKLTPSGYEMIQQLWDEGVPVSEIAEKLDVSRNYVYVLGRELDQQRQEEP
jgi:hypothetical protein